jgi:hypothetical protein
MLSRAGARPPPRPVPAPALRLVPVAGLAGLSPSRSGFDPPGAGVSRPRPAIRLLGPRVLAKRTARPASGRSPLPPCLGPRLSYTLPSPSSRPQPWAAAPSPMPRHGFFSLFGSFGKYRNRTERTDTDFLRYRGFSRTDRYLLRQEPNLCKYTEEPNR